MFDPSFLELIVICVVALLVLGPDKLPGAIKTLGLWIGRLRRSFNNIRREIEQEVGADEIRRQLRNEAIMEKFNSTKNQVTESIQSVKKEAEAVKDDLNLQKEFSGFGEGGAAKEEGGTGKEETGEADDIDPVEKLATNDPAARTIEPEQDTATTTPDAAPADPAGGQDGTSTDNQQPEEKPTEEKQKNSDT